MGSGHPHGHRYRASALIHTHTCLHNVTQKQLSTCCCIESLLRWAVILLFITHLCWKVAYYLVIATSCGSVDKVSGGAERWSLITSAISIMNMDIPMFGEPEASSLIPGCWEAQWDGWLFNSSACSHKDMFDFHPYGDVWCLILNKKDLLWVNVSLSQREATYS